MLTRVLGDQARNRKTIESQLPAAMWRGQMSRSHVSKFATEFFAAELRAWRGEQPLWKVFWAYVVAASTVLITFYVRGRKVSLT